MLTTDVHFGGFSTESWTRFLALFKPRAKPTEELTRPRGAIVCIHDGSRVLKLLHTHRGRIDARNMAWPIPLAQLAAEHRASWAIAGRLGALEEVMERFGARLRRTDDLMDQVLLLLAIFRELGDEGELERWPRRLAGIPAPTAPVVSRAIDGVCPSGHSMVLGVFHKGDLWTLLAARRRERSFDMIVGPEDLRRDMGILAGDFRRDYRHVARVVERQVAPVAMGCFAERDTLAALITDARPGAWSRAVAVRDVVLSPIPTGLAMALGVDGARYAFESFRAFAGRFETFRRVDPLLEIVKDKVGEAAGDRDVTEALGFNPLEVLRALLSRDGDAN